MEYRIRKATTADAKAIAQVHKVCFEDSFMGILDLNTLSRYYRIFIEEPNGICLVAETEGRVVAYNSGWLVGATYQKDLASRCGVIACLAIIKALLTRPATVWKLVRPRLKVFWNLWKQHGVSAQAGQERAQQTESRTVNASYLSVAVLPLHRRSRLASLLMQAFIHECASREIREIWLTVTRHNNGAIQLYEKSGWVRFAEEGESFHYRYVLG